MGSTFPHNTYGTIAANTWYHYIMSCNNVWQNIGTVAQFSCHLKTAANAITPQVFSSATTQLTKTQFQYIIGDSSNNAGTGFFVLKDLVITDGAMFNTKDVTPAMNCLLNCDVYLSNGRCL